MGKLTNQVAVVTGASKGIGADISKALAAEGASEANDQEYEPVRRIAKELKTF